MLLKSPSGRVKVAFAGLTTSVCAVLFTLPDVAAIGSATIKSAVPMMVAARQPGRTTRASLMTSTELSAARAGIEVLKTIISTQSAVMHLVFMAVLIERQSSSSVEKIKVGS